MSKLDGYIRVSDVHGRSGDSFISPDQQHDKIEAWAHVHNHEIVHWEKDLDVSGGKLSRPGLDRIMERIRSGQTEGIAIAKLDRFSRAGVGDALALIAEIKEAGAVFGCIEPAIDTSDPIMGEFVLTIFLALAKMERDRIGASWADAQARAHARGAHMGRVAPFGYRKRADDGRLEPDPVTAPYVPQIFQRRVAGEGWTPIARWLNQQPDLTPFGHRFSMAMLKYLIRNEAYIGHLVRGDMRLENAHPPLVDFRTWQAVQSPMRTPRSGRTPPGSLLTGLARCSGCRYTMAWQHSAFMCRRARLGLCSEPAGMKNGRRSSQTKTYRDGLETYVVDEMWKKMKAQIDGQGFGLGTNLDTLELEWKDAEQTYIETSSDLELMETMGRDGWLALVKAMALDRDAKKAAYEEKVRTTGGRGLDVRQLRKDWESGAMSFDEKRSLLARLVQAVFIRRAPAKGSHGDLRDRVHIVWTDEDVVDVPRTGTRTDLGKPAFVPRPFIFPNGDHPDEFGEAGSEPDAVPSGGDVTQAGRV